MPLKASQSASDGDHYSSQTLSNLSSSFFTFVRGVAWTASSNMRSPDSLAASSSDAESHDTQERNSDSESGCTPFFDPESSPVARIRSDDTTEPSESPRLDPDSQSSVATSSQRARRNSMNLSMEQASGNGEIYPATATSQSTADLSELPDLPEPQTSPSISSNSRSGLPTLHLRIPSDSQHLASASRKKSFTPALSAIPQSPFDLLTRHASQTPLPSSADIQSDLLDPVTFQTLTRSSNSNKIVRTVNERQERDRMHSQLAKEEDQQDDNDQKDQKSAESAKKDASNTSFFSKRMFSLRRKAKSLRGHSSASQQSNPDETRTSVSGDTENTEKNNENLDATGNVKTSMDKQTTDFGPPHAKNEPDSKPPAEQKLNHNKSILRRLSVRPRTAASERRASGVVPEKPNRPATAQPVNTSTQPRIETSTKAAAAATPSNLNNGESSVESPRQPICSPTSNNRARFVKVRTKNKNKKDFNALFLAQSLCINATTPTSPSSLGVPQTSLPTDATLSGRRVSISSNAGSELNQSTQSPGTARPAKRNAIWTLKFSESGQYLAAAGHDGIIRVWSVLNDPSAREREISEHDPRSPNSATEASNENKEQASTSNSATPLDSGNARSRRDCKQECRRKVSPFSNCTASSTYAPVFASKPIREYQGHTADVLEISWSKNDFLLSSSVDKTVRLWHVSRDECLCAFQHLDFVTSIAFHPRDDRFFISGSLDCKLRLWSIHEKRVFLWTEVPYLITSVSFSNDGELAFAGTIVGECMIFETSTLKLRSKFVAKSSSGKNSKGRKVTSIMPLAGPTIEEDKLLVTTNDSRIRMYNVIDKGLEAKFRGHENSSSQIRATFSEDGKYIICGSEDRHVYIWDSGLYDVQDYKKGWLRSKEKSSYESFQADSNIVTCSIFAPLNIGTHLRKANDPMFAGDNNNLVRMISGTSVKSGETIKTDRRDSIAAAEAEGRDTLMPITSLQGRRKSFSASAVERARSDVSKLNKNGVAAGREFATSPTMATMEDFVMSGPENAIIAVSDDNTGFIRIYRNSSSWAANVRKNNNNNNNLASPEMPALF